MAKAPAFQFYSADWFIDTAQMSRAAKGLHIDLLAIQWSNKFIEADEKGNPVGLSIEDLALWETIRHKYILSEGKLTNQKLEERRAAHEAFRDRQSENGARGGRPKSQTKAKQKPNKSHLKPKLNPDESQKNPLEDEDEDEVEEVIEEGNEELGDGVEEGHNPYLIPAMLVAWKKSIPTYPEDHDKDFPALLALSEFICKQAKTPYNPRDGNCMSIILTQWEKWAVFVSKHDFFKRYSLAQVNTHSQNILQSIEDGQHNGRQQNANGQNQQPRGTIISGEKSFGKL